MEGGTIESGENSEGGSKGALKLFENESVSEFSVQSSTPDKMTPENSVRKATELCGMAESPNRGRHLRVRAGPITALRTR